MATLYVENVPDELYEALRGRAKARHRSIAGEVIAILEENLPTAAQLEARHEFLRKVIELRAEQKDSGRTFPTTEEMVREDRER